MAQVLSDHAAADLLAGGLVWPKSESRNERPLRIFYAAGPGDVIGTYRYWKVGQDDPSEVARTYSSQFFDFCREIDAEAFVLSSHPRRDRIDDPGMRIEHRPIPFAGARGLQFHIGQIISGIRMTFLARRFEADVAIISTGAHWFSLCAMRLLGIKTVASLHCVLRPKEKQLGRIGRSVASLNRMFFRRCLDGAVCVSRDVAEQLRGELRGADMPVIPFIPTFRRGSFFGIGEPLWNQRPFRVLFVGRIQRDKGVFDLLEIARRLADAGRTDIEFDLCGSGGDLDDLKRQAREAGLESSFRCHGHCDKRVMRGFYGCSHVVIVPTRSDFVEGFNKVVAEGVLAGRPVIASSVCPALDYVREAVIKVPADDLEGYRNAIVRLCDDSDLYEATRRQCAAVRSQFFIANNGWRAALRKTLQKLDLVAEGQPQSLQTTPIALSEADHSMAMAIST